AMSGRLKFSGRPDHQFRQFAALMGATAGVSLRRALGRPLVPSWPWAVEVGTELLREQMRLMFTMTPPEARAFADSMTLPAPVLERVRVGEPVTKPVPGRWFEPAGHAGRTLLYLHGGGYAFHGGAFASFVALVAEATRARTFALDYRLTPEHPYPAQLDDAQAAYRALLASGVDPERLVVAGDSAGGHLTLSLLVALRDVGAPLPAVALALCPWTHSGARGASLFANDPYDWVQGAHAVRFGEWLRRDLPADDPRVSPLLADLRGLPPIVLQAGGREILYDQIVEFAGVAKAQGVHVKLQVWPEMNHDFQAFGPDVPEAREALAAMRAAVEEYCR
ncbi:MAG: alpha/beta hydrolase, partial [Candidatus Eisenbacteria bacterium]